MGNKDGHRRFGNTRSLPSGRFQIRYPGPDGRLRTGTTTYASKVLADRALTMIEAQMLTGEWTDPQRGKVKFGVYAETWIVQRANLRARTVELYTWLLVRHIRPYLGDMPVSKITPELVRDWRATLLREGVSASATAKAYRLLRAILMTAADDRIIPRNPCRIRGAGDETPEERPVLTVAQVFDMADRMSARRFRALVLLATFASLRWGEAIALTRNDIDLAARTVSVRRQYVELTGQLVLGPPKSQAGTGTVAIPASIIPALRDHLDTYVGIDGTALVFTGPRGGVLRRGNFRRGSGWAKAAAGVGVPGLHFHDLRHTGNTLAEMSGVALGASFGRSGERARPAVQRAALEQARSHGSPCTLRDLGCHHPLASSRTMMQPVPLQQMPA
jgi:integrase